ncbi:MAG: aldehyde dehydrogenase [Bryobacteraceae bacterium]
MTLDRQLIAEIAREVVERLETQLQAAPGVGRTSWSASAAGDGVFPTVDEAVRAAAGAQRRVAAMSLEDRGRIVAIIRRMCIQNAPEWARLELDETDLGRLDHKIEKLRIVKNVLGVEAIESSQVRSDSTGLCIVERAPWGVIGMVLPVTHSVPTMASNAINVIAAGNTAVFSPHPAAAKVAGLALRAFNREIERETGVANVITTVAEPSLRSVEEIFRHPGIALLCVTGGPAVVKAAAKSGKRVIAAGPGNPPVVVDETADLDHAAESIVLGASFDNNLLCIGEKEVFVVERVFDEFRAALARAHAFEIDAAAIERLADAAFHFENDAQGGSHPHLKKDLFGKDVAVLAAAAGVEAPPGAPLLFGETAEDHAFVQEEQMMPFLPIVRVRDVDAAIAAAVKAEQGFRHTAIIHSRNLDNVTKMARALDTTLFVHNGPSVAALGSGAPGYLSFSIATPTGEGVTTPLTFTRERQLAIGGGALRIV